MFLWIHVYACLASVRFDCSFKLLITYNHWYYASMLACRALFGSLVPAVCNCASHARMHELPQSHCGDNHFGEHSVCFLSQHSFFIHISIYVCMYVCMYVSIIYLSIYLSINISLSLSIYLSIYLSGWLS